MAPSAKKKTLNALLIAGVAGVWGLIFWKISGGEDREKSTPAFHPVVQPAVSMEPQQDTVRIVADYRDPFLNTRSPRPTSGEGNRFGTNRRHTVPEVKKPEPQPVVAEVKWPSIHYGGIIRNSTTDSCTIALVNINNSDAIVKAGQTYGKVHILAIYEDSIRLAYGGEVKKVMR